MLYELTLNVRKEDIPRITSALNKNQNIEINIGESPPNRFFVDRSLKSEPVVITAISILAVKVIPTLIEAIRDIIVAYLKTHQNLLKITKPDGSTIDFAGPIKTKDIKEIENAITDQFIQKE